MITRDFERKWNYRQASELKDIKTQLMLVIKAHCVKKRISCGALARAVPGLSAGRVSRMFTGYHGTVTIDKMVYILSILGIGGNFETSYKEVE